MKNKQSKTIGLLMVALFTLIVSCKKEKENEKENVSLIGTWHVETEHSTFQQAGAAEQKTTKTYKRGEFLLEFLTAKSLVINGKNNAQAFTYNYSKETQTLYLDAGDGDMVAYKVEELTASRLRLFLSETEIVKGANITVTSTQQLICSK